MKRALIVAAVALLGVAAVAAVSAGGANATHNDKVTICHATSSNKNPYRMITVDRSAIDEQNNDRSNGHGNHERDIIPPFPGFPGRNWDTGQAIWENGCVPPEQPTVVTPVAPTLSERVCDVPRDVLLPTVTGVQYSETDNSDGSITVTATAISGYVLADGATTEWTFTDEDLAPLPADDPLCVQSFPPTVPPLMPVTPDDPELIEPTCDAPGDIELPTVTGVVYTETVQLDGDVVVTAAAANGYVLTAGSTTTWNYSATQLAQLPDDDPLCVASLPPTVPPVEPTPDEPTAPVPTPGEPTVASAPPTPGAAAPEAVGAAPATTLPATGGETWAILAVGMVSLISGAWLYRLSRRAA